MGDSREVRLLWMGADMPCENLLLALRKATIIDLSQTLEERMPNSPNHSKYFHNLWGSYELGDRSLNYQLSMSEHSGTHVDAPAHFISRAQEGSHVTIENIPLSRFMTRGVKIDCRSFVEGDYVSRKYIADWECKYGRLNEDDMVIFDFGWAAHWGLRPDSQRYLQDYPGIGVDAAEYLIQIGVGALGVDTLSPDPPEAHRQKRSIHPLVLQKQILIAENLTNLGVLPNFFIFIGFPLKIRNGSGAPMRAVALV